MKIPLALLVSLLIIGCSEKTTETNNDEQRAEWYAPWIERDLKDGATFHSEFLLKTGEIKWIELQADNRMRVGFIAKKGDDITKSGGSITMGTEDDPHRASGSPGFSQIFESKDGLVRLCLENTSTIDTRIALHTK